jgi:hypothetical protein
MMVTPRAMMAMVSCDKPCRSGACWARGCTIQGLGVTIRPGLKLSLYRRQGTFPALQGMRGAQRSLEGQTLCNPKHVCLDRSILICLPRASFGPRCTAEIPVGWGSESLNTSIIRFRIFYVTVGVLKSHIYRFSRLQPVL